jgi:hypothetical protein
MGFINPDPFAASLNMAVPVGMFMQPPLMQTPFNGMPPMPGKDVTSLSHMSSII